MPSLSSHSFRVASQNVLVHDFPGMEEEPDESKGQSRHLPDGRIFWLLPHVMLMQSFLSFDTLE